MVTLVYKWPSGLKRSTCIIAPLFIPNFKLLQITPKTGYCEWEIAQGLPETSFLAHMASVPAHAFPELRSLHTDHLCLPVSQRAQG